MVLNSGASQRQSAIRVMLCLNRYPFDGPTNLRTSAHHERDIYGWFPLGFLFKTTILNSTHACHGQNSQHGVWAMVVVPVEGLGSPMMVD